MRWIRICIPRYHSVLTPTKRVITVAPMPPEKSAYALARYSRSPDSIRDSIEWVRTHDSEKFLESFYFQYGHASIADLGHTVMCFEGISELAATEIEDGAAVGRPGEIVALPGFFALGIHHAAGIDRRAAAEYQAAGEALLAAYAKVNDLRIRHLARAPAASRRHEAGRLRAQPRGARLRRGALPAVLGRAHQCRPGHQHPHAGKADPAAEGFRIRRTAQPGRRNRAGLRRAARLRLGRRMPSPSRSRPRSRATPTPTGTLAQSREDLQLWAAQNLPARAGQCRPTGSI